MTQDQPLGKRRLNRILLDLGDIMTDMRACDTTEPGFEQQGEDLLRRINMAGSHLEQIVIECRGDGS